MDHRRYNEARAWPYWAACFAGSALLLALNLTVAPVSQEEAATVAAARSVLRSGDFMDLRVDGHSVRPPPAYSWLIALSNTADAPDWVLRLPGYAGLLLLGLLCARTAARHGGMAAGAVAGLAPLTCVGGVQYGTSATNDILFGVLLSAAWFSWYELGRERQRWFSAWALALALVCAAFFAGGVWAFLFFYGPLLVLRKPGGIRKRLYMGAHLVPAITVLLVVIAWAVGSQVTGEHASWRSLVGSELHVQPRYLHRLVLYPARALGAFFPWVLLAWPAFCLAFRPVERNPALFHYLRRTITIPFLICWLLPGMSVKTLLPLLGPAAVLTGLHYEILYRRYRIELERLLRGLAGTVTAAGTVGLAGAVGLATGWIEMPVRRTDAAVAAMALSLSAIALSRLPKQARGGPFWMRFSLGAVSAAVLWAAALLPWEASRRTMVLRKAAQLRRTVPPGVPVYKDVPPNSLVVCHYLRRAQTPMSGVTDIPDAADPAPFFLGTLEIPVQENRVWTPVSAPVPTATLEKPVWNLQPDGRAFLALQEGLPPRDARYAWLRMYRGDRR